MSGWRTLIAVLASLLLAGSVRAQAYSLAEKDLVGSYFHVEIAMSLSGELRVQQDGKTLRLKESGTARHDYKERILEAGKVLADKSARIYAAAAADFTADKEHTSRVFRPERRFLVAQRQRDQTIAYSPDGSLTREELELTEHFDTLALPGLLPGREVKVGESWKVANNAAQTLLDLDGLIAQDLTCKLDKVEGRTAHVSVSGTASGIDNGAAVKAKIDASCEFDLDKNRITAVEWKQTDDRDPGPISPGFHADVVTRVKRTPVEPVSELNDFALVKIPTGKEIPEKVMRLTFSDSQGHCELVHSRDWHLVGRSNQQVMMRLMERGDFIAQLTITPYRKTTAGKHLSEEEFKEAIARAPGWEPEDVEKGTVIESPSAYWIYRVSAGGSLNGVKAVQYFYLVAGPDGDQVVLTFTMAPAQAQNLNTRDLELVRSLTFPAATPPGTSR